MKCLITGAAGFIGSHLVDRLIEEDFLTVAIDNLSSGKQENVNPAAKFYHIDIRDSRIIDVFRQEKPEIVFHYAAHIEARESVDNALDDAMVNIIGSLNIIDQCRKHKVKKIIFASSGGEIYGDAYQIPTPESCPPQPVSPYGVAKLAVEHYLASYAALFGIDYVAIRYGNVFGPRQNPKGESGVIAIFGHKMMTGNDLFIHGDGKQTKDYIFIDDVIDATMLCFKKNIHGAINIATGREVSVIEIFEKIKKITGFAGKAKHIPLPACGFKRGCLCIEKAYCKLDWSPRIEFDNGLLKTIDWLEGKKIF